MIGMIKNLFGIGFPRKLRFIYQPTAYPKSKTGRQVGDGRFSLHILLTNSKLSVTCFYIVSACYIASWTVTSTQMCTISNFLFHITRMDCQSSYDDVVIATGHHISTFLESRAVRCICLQVVCWNANMISLTIVSISYWFVLT